MKYQSKKRRQLMALWSRPRNEFVGEFGYCWVCGQNWNLCCHEMAKGSHRDAALTEICTWFVACSECNTGPLNDYSIWPLERQLAFKWMEDHQHFDLLKFNAIRGRAENAITLAEVIPHICREFDKCLY